MASGKEGERNENLKEEVDWEEIDLLLAPPVPRQFTEAEKAAVAKERNYYIAMYCQDELEELHEDVNVKSIWDDHDEYSETTFDLDLQDLSPNNSQVHALVCAGDTWKYMKEEMSGCPDEEFDYQLFQEFLKWQSKLAEWKFLKENVLKVVPQLMKLPGRGKLKKEFVEMYGPVDFRDPTMEAYMNVYTESRQEQINAANEKLMVYRKLLKDDGEEMVINLLEHEQRALKDRFEDLGLEKMIDNPMYDMNPFTNPIHCDWFLLPRPSPSPKHEFVSHYPLDLVELKVPEYLEGKVIYLKGYWPSLIDYEVMNLPIRGIPVDPILKKIYNRRGGYGSWDWDCRLNHWMELGPQLIEEIREYQFGIGVRQFFELLMEKYRYYSMGSFFEGLELTKVVRKYLNEIILTVEVPGKTEAHPKMVILYPSFMRGVIDKDGKTTMRIWRTIWDRVIFMLKEKGGRIKVNGLRRRLSFEFEMFLIFDVWGFEGKIGFLEWCIEHWNKDEEYKVVLEKHGDFFYLVHKQ